MGGRFTQYSWQEELFADHQVSIRNAESGLANPPKRVEAEYVYIVTFFDRNSTRGLLYAQ